MAEVSVIVPLYNKGKTIEQTIRSVICQTYKDFELIIVNDGSTDNSLEIVSNFTDSRIVVFNKPNGGVSSARNYGAKVSNTPWLLFLDADDVLNLDAIDNLLSLRQKYPRANVLTGNHLIIGKTNHVKYACKKKEEGYISNPQRAFMEGVFMPRTGASIYSKEYFIRVGGFDERVSVYEDFLLDISMFQICTYAYTPKIVYKHDCRFAELSISPLPLDKFFVYYINLRQYNFYDKIIVYSRVLRVYYKFKSWKDRESCKWIRNKILLPNWFIYPIVKIYCIMLEKISS